FRKVDGLILNYNERTIIFGCLNEEEKQEILDIMPFKVEKLPIRYLGRLMLVASVLESIHVYWASVFLLPVGVIKDINKLLKNILWNQNDGTKESLWVKWINTEKLKGRSVWEIEEDKNDSWGWKNILSQRNEVRKFIFSKLGDSNWKWPEGWIDKYPIMLSMQRENNWSSNVIAFAKRYNGNSVNSIIRRVCIAASVYLIWQESNNMIFRDEERNYDDLYKMLNEIVRMRLMSLKVKDTLAVRRAQEIWNVEMPLRGYMVECQLNDAFSMLVLVLECEVVATLKYKISKGREM
ncbi:hypothetical protein Tco_1130249, partial [Tanacetum coccineum]